MQTMLSRFCKRDLNLNLVLYHLLRSFISHLFISMKSAENVKTTGASTFFTVIIAPALA
jgi:hypothetical protein